MASTMVPLLLCGTMIGVLLSKVFPPVLITGFLVCYLLLSTVKMFKKGKQLTLKENEDRKKIANALLEHQQEEDQTMCVDEGHAHFSPNFKNELKAS